MKSNNLTMEDRLKKLYASLGLNVGAKSSNLAMIKSICAGFSIVEQNFDTVLNEIFADSSLNIGRQKMCELFDVTHFDKDVIKKIISSKYDDYRLNELKNEFQKILDSFEIGFSSVFNMFIGPIGSENFGDIFKVTSFLDDYLCPGVVLGASGANLDFDAYDSFDYCADDWEKICNNTFNFFDSLGGNI